MSLSLRIQGIRDETDRVRVFELCAPDGGDLPSYSAGSHLTFDLGDLGTRSYSLIDWPDEAQPERYRIAVQREDTGDGGSMAMHALDVGATLQASEPKNDFPLQTHAEPALLLAGGIGITPLISMATALRSDARPFALHYAARSRGVMAFAGALETAFGEDLICHYDDAAPLDMTGLMNGLSAGTHLYVCGPKGMIEAAKAAASAAGMPEDHVHFELFTTPVPEAGDQPFEVELASSGQVFTIPVGQSIIEVLEDAGIDLIYDCQRGDCGICQTDVISGEPDHRDVVLSEAEKSEGKLMQICVSRAKSPRLVLDL